MKNKYTNKEIINKLYESAKKYKQNLLNKNILFIFEDKNLKTLAFIETVFNDYNFQHLTGVKYTKSPKKFFSDCINKKISPKNIFIDLDKTAFTYLKLEVLLNAMSINKVAKRIGNYNYSKKIIEIEKVVGNVSLSIGFSNFTKDGIQLGYYYPKTLLKDKINANVEQANKVVAILSKEKREKLYSKITYLSKDITLEKIFDVQDIKEKTSLKILHSENKEYQYKIDEHLNKIKILYF